MPTFFQRKFRKPYYFPNINLLLFWSTNSYAILWCLNIPYIFVHGQYNFLPEKLEKKGKCIISMYGSHNGTNSGKQYWICIKKFRLVMSY